MKEPEFEWWDKWLSSDHISRLRLVEQLPITNEIIEMSYSQKVDEDAFRNIFSIVLNSFFEDFLYFLEVKQRGNINEPEGNIEFVRK